MSLHLFIARCFQFVVIASELRIVSQIQTDDAHYNKRQARNLDGIDAF
jgi:hypothetical protein